ncbi:MAG: hypothetical protein H6719_30160 [Sandaracinaceae bacterium]|nr:hypothetical protein [Sandaracinaceae bacterium]
MRHARFALGLSLLLLACDGGTPDPVDGGGGGVDAGPGDVAYRAECENINGTHCMMPWPSDRWRGADGHLAIDPAATPVNSFDVPLDPAQFERFDGFSPATSLVTSFPGAVDPSLLNGEDAIAATLEASSTTVIVDAETGELVAHFAELDLWEATDPNRAPLYLRPAARFEEGRRYVVGIRGLRTTDGAAVEPSAYFRLLRDGGDAAGTDVAARRARFDTDVFPVLEAAGVPRAELIEAWDFTTATGESIWGEMVAMRDAAMTAVGERGLGCTVIRVVDSDVDTDAPSDVWRQIIGTVEVPLFTNGDGALTPDASLHRGGDGRPVQNGTAQVPFIAQIPLSVRDAVQAGEAPARIELYGHGLFGSRQEITYGWHREHQQRLGVVSIAVDWWGMSENDLERITGTLTDFSDFYSTGERLQQSVINALVLARSFRGVCSELPEMQVPMPAGTMPAVDPTQLYYYGNSQGGIMGGVLAGLATDIDRFVLGVAGMSYPLLIKRSSAWTEYGPVMAVGYPDALEADLIMVMSASLWDLAEPSTYTSHWLADPLPGTPTHRVMMQIGIGDGLVSNAASYMMARTAGLPVVTPSPTMPYGIEATTAPVDSGMVIWDIPGVSPRDPGTRNPGGENATHEAVRRTDSARDQIDAFARPDGRVEQICDGACDPE